MKAYNFNLSEELLSLLAMAAVDQDISVAQLLRDLVREALDYRGFFRTRGGQDCPARMSLFTVKEIKAGKARHFKANNPVNPLNVYNRIAGIDVPPVSVLPPPAPPAAIHPSDIIADVLERPIVRRVGDAPAIAVPPPVPSPPASAAAPAQVPVPVPYFE